MDKFGVFILCLLLQQGYPRSLPEESVVSDYTKDAVPQGQDVYSQIANNIAEKITSPIYRFLGYNRTTVPETTTKKSWSKIEILESPESAKSLTQVHNEITDKDVEELSENATNKTDRKPEKLTLYTSYLPLGKLELDSNETTNDFDDFGFDDFESDDDLKPREGPFTFFLELAASLVQLIYGAVVSIFQRKPQTS